MAAIPKNPYRCMISIFRLLTPAHLFTVLLAGCLLTAHAVYASAPALTAQEKNWLRAHPIIRIAPDPDFPPIESFDSHGNYIGIAAEYVSLLEKKLGIHFEIVHLRNWDEALQQARTHGVDMFAAAASTPQREQYMNFTTPHLEFPGVILVRNQGEQKLKLRDLHGLRVAIVSNYVWQDLISREHPEIHLEPVPDLLTGLKKVSFGSVDAMVANLATATHYIEKSGITNLRVAGESGYYGRYALGVRKDWPELTAILEKGLASISHGERRAILNRWIHLKQESLLQSRSFWTALLSALAFILLSAIITWTWSLRRMVAIRTAELKDNEQRYQTLFDSAYDATFILEGDRFIDCNEAASRMYGYSKEQFIRQPPFYCSPATQPDGSNSIQKAQALIRETLKGTPRVFEWQHRRQNGALFDAEVSLNTYLAGGHRYILAVARDITERKRIEHLKDEFISTVSHEIRTPLTSIRGSLSLLANGKAGGLPQKIASLIDIAYRNTERLLMLVNDLLDIQKMETGHMDFDLKPVDVTTFLEQAVTANLPYGKQYRVEFRLAPLAAGLTVIADSNRLMQVMNNLLSNAAKFSPPDSIVEIRAQPHNSSLRVSVHDQGPGIPPQFQPHLFERFTMADASSTRQLGGTGLGLHIAKGIIEHHGGKLGFLNREPRGTEFYFDLPLAQPHPEAKRSEQSLLPTEQQQGGGGLP